MYINSCSPPSLEYHPLFTISTTSLVRGEPASIRDLRSEATRRRMEYNDWSVGTMRGGYFQRQISDLTLPSLVLCTSFFLFILHYSLSLPAFLLRLEGWMDSLLVFLPCWKHSRRRKFQGICSLNIYIQSQRRGENGRYNQWNTPWSSSSMNNMELAGGPNIKSASFTVFETWLWRSCEREARGQHLGSGEENGGRKKAFRSIFSQDLRSS